MRKWILHWLFGSDAKRWEDMFKIACQCRADCNRMLEIVESLMKSNDNLFNEHIAIINAVKDATDLFYLKMKVLAILQAKTNNKMDDSQSEHVEE